MKRHKQRRKKGKENKDKEQANQEQSRQTTDINSTESSDGIGRSTGERVKENRDKLIQGKNTRHTTPSMAVYVHLNGHWIIH